MNFDTRIIKDLIYLDESLYSTLINEIDEELIFSSTRDVFDEDDFAEVLKPLMRDHLRLFIKTKLKTLDLLILKNIINIDNIDYKELIDHLTKK